MNQALKLLAIFPHPDDESLGMGGALARYASEGVETYLICATRGERGWTGPEETNPGLDNLGKIREAELRCAAGMLGLKEVNFLDIIDGEVDQADPREVIAKITTHIRRIQPQVVVTFAPDGIYGHPDHIAIGQFTAAALLCAANNSYQDAQELPPYIVPKFYHLVDSKAVVEELHAHIGPLVMVVDGVERSHIGWEDWAITTQIDTRNSFDRAWQAILCHQSQLPGFGPLVDLPRETLIRIWGTGTFVRVSSMVNSGRSKETDLFEGLR